MNVQNSGSAALTEAIWKVAEGNMARRERIRYIRQGRIVPAHRMQPQLMVKIDGRWCPQLGGNS